MRILILDDHSAMAKRLGILCGHSGHEVVAYTKAGDALRALREQARPDVLIVDLVMPAMGGEAGHCDTVLISGHTELAENRDGRAIGVDALIPKPLDLNQARINGGAGSGGSEVRRRASWG